MGIEQAGFGIANDAATKSYPEWGDGAGCKKYDEPQYKGSEGWKHQQEANKVQAWRKRIDPTTKFLTFRSIGTFVGYGFRKSGY